MALASCSYFFFFFNIFIISRKFKTTTGPWTTSLHYLTLPSAIPSNYRLNQRNNRPPHKYHFIYQSVHPSLNLLYGSLAARRMHRLPPPWTNATKTYRISLANSSSKSSQHSSPHRSKPYFLYLYFIYIIYTFMLLSTLMIMLSCIYTQEDQGFWHSSEMIKSIKTSSISIYTWTQSILYLSVSLCRMVVVRDARQLLQLYA